MRCIILLLATLIAAPALYGAEVSVNLDRCVVLNAEDDDSAESVIAMYFELPEEATNKQIIYAELYIPVSIENQQSDSLFEFRLFPIFADWTENEIDFESGEDITDSLTVGSFTISFGEANEFYIDITSFVREIVEGERTNYGLMAVADLLGDANIRLPENLDGPIRTSARIRIVYK